MQNLTYRQQAAGGRADGHRPLRRHAEGRPVPADAEATPTAPVRDWFKTQCEALGLAVTIDDMGNMFARRRGASRNDLPPIAMGSHLDTQPTGGKFDGVLGVLAALEAMRTLGRGRLRDPRPRRDRQLDQRGRRALCTRRCSRRAFLPAVSPPRLCLCAHRPRRQDIRRRGARAHRLSRRNAGRRAHILRDVRAAHRARPDPRSGTQNHRHRAGRARRALVRGDGGNGVRPPTRAPRR